MYRFKRTGRTICCRDAVTDGTKEIGELQLILDLDRKARGLASVADGDRLRFHRRTGVKPLKRHTGILVAAADGARLVGILIADGDDHSGRVQTRITLVIDRLGGHGGHRNTRHLFQRYGPGGGIRAGGYCTGGGLVALVRADGGIGILDILQQLVGRAALRLNSHVALLDSQTSIRRRYSKGHVHPCRGILHQRNGTYRNGRGVVGLLLTHGHVAGLLRVAGAGHGVAVSPRGQIHRAAAGEYGAVDLQRGVGRGDGERHRGGGRLPAEGGIVPGLGHEGACGFAAIQKGDKGRGFHFISGFEAGLIINRNTFFHKRRCCSLQCI